MLLLLLLVGCYITTPQRLECQKLCFNNDMVYSNVERLNEGEFTRCRCYIDLYEDK